MISARIRRESATLLFAVFLTGFCVLIVEVLATRMLAPYFGNTIFTFSSVIGIVLAFLSVGYAIGGRSADRHPDDVRMFYRIIFSGGLSVLFLAGLNSTVLPLVGNYLPMRSGPLFCSLFLFSIPSFLLGMTSPFAVALRQKICSDGVGANAGAVFFWSTLGSIAGSLLAGFVLVPHMGVTSILLLTAAVLLVLGAAGLLFHGRSAAPDPKIVTTIVLCVSVSSALLAHPVRAAGLVTQIEGVYQSIRVLDVAYKGRPVRILYQDNNASSGQYTDSGELPFAYSRSFPMVEALFGEPGKTLLIGAGAFTMPVAMLGHWPHAQVEVAEIEPALLPIAHEYFGLKDDPRMRLISEDGRRYLFDTEERYDMIFGDAYSSHHSMPPHLTTREFLTLLRSRLSDRGVFMMNFVGSIKDSTTSLFLSELRTVLSVFPAVRVFAVEGKNDQRKQNVIIVAGSDLDALCTGKKDAAVTALCAQEVDVARYDFSRHPMLTDDYAPVEYLAAFDF